jgi:hypothetical protein
MSEVEYLSLEDVLGMVRTPPESRNDSGWPKLPATRRTFPDRTPRPSRPAARVGSAAAGGIATLAG